MTSLGYITPATTLSDVEITGEVKSNAATVTAANVGTVSNGTVVEYGDATAHKTVITLSSAAVMTIAGAADEAVGFKIYDFPASSAIHINSVYANLTHTQSVGADTPDCGLGTVVATGVVAVLGGTATFEDILTGEAYATTVNDKTVATVDLAKPGSPSVFPNAADGWAAAKTLTWTGTVTIHWTYLGSTA